MGGSSGEPQLASRGPLHRFAVPLPQRGRIARQSKPRISPLWGEEAGGSRPMGGSSGEPRLASRGPLHRFAVPLPQKGEDR